MIHNITMLNCV